MNVNPGKQRVKRDGYWDGEMNFVIGIPKGFQHVHNILTLVVSDESSARNHPDF